MRALDASGTPLGEVGAAAQTSTESAAATFTAPLPAGTAAVEVTRGGAPLDRKERSRPPVVKLTAPATGVHVAGSGGLDVRWTASDPDGDPLHATIDYAAGGTDWRTVFQGPSAGRATVPGGFLEAGPKARVRVTVDDGFEQARDVSAAFETAGAAPTVQIALPDDGDELQAGRTLLVGSASGDRGRLPGRALTWFAGSKRLGRGERLQATLPAGSVRLRLVARDAGGRAGTATRRLTVAPARLALRGLRVPDRVAPGASRVAVTLAATVPARVRAGGRTFRIGPRARRIRIPLPGRPRTGVVKAELTIAATGRRQPALRQTVVVLRG